MTNALSRRTTMTYIIVLITIVLSGCYHDKSERKSLHYTNTATTDSPASRQGHEHRCYSRNFNFVVKEDSIPLISQQPEETLNGLLTDTTYVKRHDRLVVADIRILPNDRHDSVWVQVARDQSTIGWTHESLLLKNAVPDDPISQFISTFSDTHLLIFLVIISIIAISYSLRIMLKKKAYIVHVNDIGSIYPTLLCVTVAVAATFYSSIQKFMPEIWQQFYFHPSLNPFAVPLVLGVFLSSVWAILILSIATFDDVRNQLPLTQAILYLCGTAAICAANYIVFSITTLYYVGYVLLFAYVLFAAYRYIHTTTAYKYVCGNCGHRLKSKGVCPHCGADND